MKFVPNARQAWRWFSVQAMALSTAALSAWALLPEDWKAYVPAEWMTPGVAVVLFLGIIGRLVDQGTATAVKPEDQQ